jgi:hypothetical protein
MAAKREPSIPQPSGVNVRLTCHAPDETNKHQQRGPVLQAPSFHLSHPSLWMTLKLSPGAQSGNTARATRITFPPMIFWMSSSE